MGKLIRLADRRSLLTRPRRFAMSLEGAPGVVRLVVNGSRMELTPRQARAMATDLINLAAHAEGWRP